MRSNKRLICLISLILLFQTFSCSSHRPYFEGAPNPPPSRLNKPHIPSDKCTSVCLEIMRIEKLSHLIDQTKALSKIAEKTRLSCHEQIYLVEASLPLEMFGLLDIFTCLARHKYLRHSARSVLLYHTDRLNLHERKEINQLLQINKGVPDELTPMEEFFSKVFSIDTYTILDFYLEGLQEQDILILLYLHKTVPKRIDVLLRWRRVKQPVKPWYDVILENLSINPDSVFVPFFPGVKVPEPFKHPYELYRLGLDKHTFLSDDEIGLIIKLKVVTDYYFTKKLVRPPTDDEVLELMQKIAGGKGFEEIIRRKKDF